MIGTIQGTMTDIRSQVDFEEVENGYAAAEERNGFNGVDES